MLEIGLFGNLLSKHLRTTGLTVGKLSKLTRLPRASVYNWVSGRSFAPRDWQDVLKLAQALSLSDAELDQLLEAANFPPAKACVLAGLPPTETLTPVSHHPLTGQHIPTAETERVIGKRAVISCIVAWLLNETGHKFISLEGIGGIGKTTLARAVLDEPTVKAQFDMIVWVSARQERLTGRGNIEAIDPDGNTASELITHLTEQLGYTQWSGLTIEEQLAYLRPILATNHNLIIIDNLETIQDVETLIPLLRPLANPTRFLITSRQTLQHFSFVRSYKLPQLSRKDSVALIIDEIERRGERIALTERQIDLIMERVGGLPLALKLLAAQISFLPFDKVIAQLQDQHSTSAVIYSFIYRVIWHNLHPNAQKLLLSFLDIAPDGETLDWIEIMANMPPAQFVPALRELLDYALIEITYQGTTPFYFLHRMTTTFLQCVVLGLANESERIL